MVVGAYANAIGPHIIWRSLLVTRRIRFCRIPFDTDCRDGRDICRGEALIARPGMAESARLSRQGSVAAIFAVG